jgi:hypothetical protein
MLTVYTNQKDLLKANNTTEVSRLSSVDTELLDSRDFSITLKDNQRPKLELHVYTPDGLYLTGNHNTLYTIEDTDTNTQLNAYKHLAVDLSNELETLGITRGQYRLIYNLFDNVLGSFDSEKVFIKEISPSRRELRLQLSNNSNTELNKQLFDLRDRWTEISNNDIFDSFVLNFGFNETYQIINFRFEIDFNTTPEVFIKLYDPLPSKYAEKSKVFISEEIIIPFLDTVTIVPKHVPMPANTLAGPNFDLDEFDGYSVATSFKSWNDLLSENLSTSQQIIDNYFSGSLSGVKLNVDYRYFDNFVHYSSAAERVKNFKFKLELIEYYSQQINAVNNITNGGPAVITNLNDLYTKRNNVVGTFDDFERYLFFETTGSKLYSFYDVTGSYGITSSIDPWPKVSGSHASSWGDAYEIWSNATTQWSLGYTNSDLYTYFNNLAPVASDTGEEYYNNLIEIATIYDKFNIHKLRNSIPDHIQNTEGNEEYILFVDMMGQHFDILWAYIKQLTSINTREEHPKDGMPDELLYHVASSMGFDLLNGRSSSELWKYSLGTDADGNILQSTVDSIKTISDETNTKEIWRRLINNLPYILKSKGTSRSIKALLSCFGIPSTILTIKEYGGPSSFTDNDHFPEYVHNVYHYAWLAESGSLNIPARIYNNKGVKITPNTLEFRFKTDSNFNYNTNTLYNIVSSVNNRYSLFLTKDSADGIEGTLHFKDFVTNNEVTASNLQIFDDSWHTVVITEENTGSIDTKTAINIAKALYGKTIYIKSGSFVQNASGSNFIFIPSSLSGSFALGSGSINFATASYAPLSLSKFYGHFQEIRLWSGSLNYNTISEHAASPNTYTYNVDRELLSNGAEASAPYDHLLQRWPLNNKVFLSGSIYQLSANPDNNNVYNDTASLYFIGYTNTSSINFEGFEETYYTPSPSLGGSSLYTNKVRIESASLDPNLRLNTKTRIEKSSYDRYSLDSNRLGVYFSPQTVINEDIFNQLGYFEIDDYIGNPSDIYNDHYNDLNNFAIQYWKKYDNRNDFEAYFRALEIYDFTLFRYIKQLLPQRANAIVGLVVEPNVLERGKVKLYNKPKIENLKQDAFFNKIEPTLTSEYNILNANISESVAPNIFSEYQSLRGLIEDAIDVNRLGTKWLQHRYLGKYKITEYGTYYPTTLQSAPYGNSNRIINNSKLSTYLVDQSNKFVLYLTSGSFTLNSSTSKRFTLPSPGYYFISASFNEGLTSFGIYDGNSSNNILIDSVSSMSVYNKELYFSNNFFDIKETGYNSVSFGTINCNALTLSSSSSFVTITPTNFTLTNGESLLISSSVQFDGDPYIISASFSSSPFPYNFVIKDSAGNILATSSFADGATQYSASLSLPRYTSKIYFQQVPYYTLLHSNINFNKFNIYNLNYSEVQDYVPTGTKNQRYDGSKLTGPKINVDSPTTIDGGPVVKITKVNPNQIVFANNQITTLDQSVTGTKSKSI